MLPDPAELRAIADRIADHARAARRRADVLGAVVATTTWLGQAADAFAGRSDPVLAGLRHGAARLDDAADSLRRLAVRLQQAIETLAALQHDASRAFGELGLDPGWRLIRQLGNAPGFDYLERHGVDPGWRLATRLGAAAPGLSLLGGLVGGVVGGD